MKAYVLGLHLTQRILSSTRWRLSMNHQKRTRFRGLALVLCGLCFSEPLLCGNTTQAQNKQQLIRVKDARGKETSLLEKVVVVSNKATLSKTPQAGGEPIEPWAIFFRVKNDNGSVAPVNGRLRVGDASGKSIGWIGEKDLRSWNTRFILDPIEPQPNRKFVVNLPGGGTAEQRATPEGKRRYALITDSPIVEKGDDTEYPVVVYAGNVQGDGESGTLARQRNELDNVKLEMMFVIESTDFMTGKDSETNLSLLDHVKASIREVLGELRKDEKIRKAVRLGFTEYKDTVPKASFTSRLTCDLTDDFDLFSSSLDKMAASDLNDDWPDDVLAGVSEAVTNASWSENSVKHVVILGMASCQLSPKGANPPQSGRSSVLERYLSERRSNGFNSSGMSISQLIARARPQGGGVSRARSARMFHALHFGRDLTKDFDQERLAALENLKDIVSNLTLSDLASLDSETLSIVGQIYKLQTQQHQRSLAHGQYREMAKNNGEADGIFKAVAPDDNSRQRAVEELGSKVRATFAILEKVREGEGLPMQNQNQIAQPLFTLVGAAAEKFKNQPVIPGTATVRNQRGREVAFKKVMVSEDELRRLRSTLDSLFTQFKGKTSKADRQDVGSVLETLKGVIAETSAGQEVTANAKLKELISDLPLRTAALETSAADLALMATEDFTEWLDRVESAAFRIDDLLNNRQDWLTLSPLAVNDRFTFLRLSELP